MDAWVVTAVEVAGQELKGPNQLTNGETGWVGPFVANPAAIAILFLEKVEP